MPIVTDGEYEIEIQAVDVAGNKSDTTITYVYKDSKKPEVGELTVVEQTAEGFILYVGATDETSGLNKVECTINGNKLPNDKIEINEITTSGIKFEVTGLEPEKQYTIAVDVFDNAGISASATGITASTITAADPPVFTVLDNETWSSTSKEVQYEGYKNFTLIYTEDGTDPKTSSTKKEGPTATANGTQTITVTEHLAQVRGYFINKSTGKTTVEGTRSEQAKIDKTPPENVTVSATVNGKTITVTATAEDLESGIASYEFQVSTTSGTSGFTTPSNGKINSTATQQVFTYTGSSGTTYWCQANISNGVGYQTTFIPTSPVTTQAELCTQRSYED